MKLPRITIIASLMVSGVFLLIAGSHYLLSTGYIKDRANPPHQKTDDHKANFIKKAPKPCVGKKRPVFINWRKLYWGNLGDLTKPERFFESNTPVQPTEVGYVAPTGNEALRYFTQELRAALRAFEKKHCVRIVWYKADVAIPDATPQFINFWDKDFGQMKAAQERTQKIERGKSQ
jgi:hypothetical protein